MPETKTLSQALLCALYAILFASSLEGGGVMRNLAIRGAMMGASEELPYARELEYVYAPQSSLRTDAWWFKSDIVYSDTIGFEANLIRLIDTTSDQAAFGSRNNRVASNSRFHCGVYSNAYYWGWNALYTGGSPRVGVKYKQGLNFRNSRTATLNDVVYFSNLPTHVQMSGKNVHFPIYIMAEDSESIGSATYQKYYAYGETKFSDGVNIVADYIPVELNDGTITFYDKITKKVMVKSSYARAKLSEYIVT